MIDVVFGQRVGGPEACKTALRDRCLFSRVLLCLFSRVLPADSYVTTEACPIIPPRGVGQASVVT